MARLASEGKDIHYLVITRGDKGSNEPRMTPERLSSIREDEQQHYVSSLIYNFLCYLFHPEGISFLALIAFATGPIPYVWKRNWIRRILDVGCQSVLL